MSWFFGVLTLRCFYPSGFWRSVFWLSVFWTDTYIQYGCSRVKWDETVLIVTVRQQATFLLAALMQTDIFDAIYSHIVSLRLRYIRAKFFNWAFSFISVDLSTSCQRSWHVWIHLHGNIVRSLWGSDMGWYSWVRGYWSLTIAVSCCVVHTTVLHKTVIYVWSE